MSGDLVLRALPVDDLGEFIALEALVWGWKADEGRLPCFREFLDPRHTRGVYDGDQLVATHGIAVLPLAVPGGAVLDMAGITALVIHPLYRGRGLMSVLTEDAVASAREAGLAVSGGIPIHSRTHLRYGYGFAARYAQVELDLDAGRELAGVIDDGRVEYVDHQAALKYLAELTLRMLEVRNGWVPRPPCTDAYKYAGTSGRPVDWIVHRSATGGVDGLAGFRRANSTDEYGRARGTLRISELFGVSAAAEGQLWRTCMADPLVSRITATRRPVYDPVTARLAEPRAWRQTVRDDMILRLLDVPVALAARRYAREDSVVIAVPGEEGRFALTGGLNSADCRSTDEPADLTVTRSALGAAYLGDVALVDLAAGGQVTEHTPGCLRRADAMFAWSPAPWLPDAF
ncbi:MAG TPA: GNAT family N-acetyltransferase [Pseudonocardiaceae bacterium]|jgi:predicted acetyltransferase|nr:GNAT family N-acetyltransferase [Pseudonocardiaceae bacterium]